MAGWLTTRVAEAKARRDEATARFEAAREQPKPLPELPKQPEPQMRPATRPEKPATMPQITPVSALKNRVAVYNQYTPEAAQELRETPVRVKYGESKDGWGGGYGNGQIGVVQYSARDDGRETLSHEFAHKWHEQKLSPEKKDSWRNTAADVVNSYATENNELHPFGNENELYAYNSQRGPYLINDGVRDYYYPGLYQDEVQPPSPPVPDWQRYRLQNDEYPIRWDAGNSAPYSTEQWVNNFDAPYGYYEDGWPVPSPATMPAKWDKPQWPSLRLYNETRLGW